MIENGNYFEVVQTLPVDPIALVPGGPVAVPFFDPAVMAGAAGAIAGAFAGPPAVPVAVPAPVPIATVVVAPAPAPGWTQNEMLAAGAGALALGVVVIGGVAVLAWWAIPNRRR